MDNAYFILSDSSVEIKRMHFCTWDVSRKNSYVEFGFEVDSSKLLRKENSLYLSSSSIRKDDEVISLYENLKDSSNSRFIFNDVVSGTEFLNQYQGDGYVLKFESREPITIVPCTITVTEGIIQFSFLFPDNSTGNLYFRVLLSLSRRPIALIKDGIATSVYTYDIKLNETRNLPRDVYRLIKEKNLTICKVDSFFCLHAVPDCLGISFIDNAKLKNIRRLESDAFLHFLPQIKEISNGGFNILFLKDMQKSSYSFFTVLHRELIGSLQIAIALGANLLCGLLFAISSWREFSLGASLSNFPIEYYISIAIILLLGGYFILFKGRR